MPLPKARKKSSKKAKQKVVGKVIRKLNSEKPSMPRDQKIAIGLERAGLSKKKRASKKR